MQQYSRENCTLREKKLGLSVSSLGNAFIAPCSHEEADTRILARATGAAKMPNKKISSCTVDTDVVVLVIPVVQQL